MDALQTQTVISTTAPQPSYIPGLIAVVGCDGTGKSTLTTDLVKSLQQHWQTERRYLGLLSGEDGDKIKRLPLVGVWLERRLAAKSSKTQSMKTKSPALWAAVIMYCFSLRRMANLRKVQRLAQSGVLVVSDRFPQAEISGFYYDGYNGTKILEIDSRAPYSEVLEQAQKAVSLVAIVSDRRSLT